MGPESNPTLAFEILDLIVQAIASKRDNHTLKQCSLVCQAFCALSQQALFSSISVTAGSLPLAETLVGASHLAKYAVSFHIEHERMRDVALPGVLATMINVRILSIDGCSQAIMTRTLAPFQKHIFPLLTSLHVETTPSLPFSSLTCPNLDTLTLNNVVPALQSDDLPDYHSLPNIRSLTLILYEDQSFHLRTSLTRFLSCSRLESLVFGSVWSVTASFTSVELFINRHKDSLQVIQADCHLCS